MSDHQTVDDLILLWSMRPQPGTPTGNAWERGVRQGWNWASDRIEQLERASDEYIARTDPLLFCTEDSTCGKCRSCYMHRAEKAERELAEARSHDARELAAKMLDEHVIHIKENAQALRRWACQEDEARARELAAMYLAECASCLRMDQKLAELGQALKITRP